MKRAAIERPRTLRVWRAHVCAHRHDLRCVCEQQPGRFRKGERAAGCGRARCWLCHYDKFAGSATLDERRARVALHEGLTEITPARCPRP